MTEYTVHIENDNRGAPVKLPGDIVLPSRFFALAVETEPGTSPLPPWILTKAYELTFEVRDDRPVLVRFAIRGTPEEPVTGRAGARCSAAGAH